MHVTQVHPVTSENQFPYTRLYGAVSTTGNAHACSLCWLLFFSTSFAVVKIFSIANLDCLEKIAVNFERGERGRSNNSNTFNHGCRIKSFLKNFYDVISTVWCTRSVCWLKFLHHRVTLACNVITSSGHVPER